MTDLKNLTCLVIDYGNYISVAQRLGAEDGFGTTYYYTPYVFNGFPDHVAENIGRNVPNIIKVREWADIIHEVDCVVFPDAHEPALQTYFVSIGKKVFGSKYASELEHDRVRMKTVMKDIDLPLGNYYVAKGIDELEKLLMQHENVYVKSYLRGDMETWKSINYTLSRFELQRMRNSLGVSQNEEIYIVEEPIESLCEIGIDTLVCSGRYPEETMSGIELKDIGFYGRITPYKNLPKQLRAVTDKFASIFRDLEYNGWYSNEVIISKDKKGYLLDNTMRFPQPPIDLVLHMYTNFPQIVWDVANGHVPTIEYKHSHGVQLIITSETALKDPVPIIVPEELKPYVKLKFLTIDTDGTWYFTPYIVNMKQIGSVIGTGNSMREATNMAKMIAESIKGFDIHINTDCIDQAKEQMDNLAKAGISLY